MMFGLFVSDQPFESMVHGLLKHTVPEIRPSEISDPRKYLILDAREKQEYDVSHLPGAIWVGFKDFTLARLPAVPRNAEVIVYCSVGYRSEKVTEKIRSATHREVRNLVGGIFAWVNDGRLVVDSRNRATNRIHGYDRQWGKWLRRGAVVYD